MLTQKNLAIPLPFRIISSAVGCRFAALVWSAQYPLTQQYICQYNELILMLRIRMSLRSFLSKHVSGINCVPFERIRMVKKSLSFLPSYVYSVATYYSDGLVCLG